MARAALSYALAYKLAKETGRLHEYPESSSKDMVKPQVVDQGKCCVASKPGVRCRVDKKDYPDLRRWNGYGEWTARDQGCNPGGSWEVREGSTYAHAGLACAWRWWAVSWAPGAPLEPVPKTGFVESAETRHAGHNIVCLKVLHADQAFATNQRVPHA